ncbi:TrmH family RNA methyltransferase [Leucobacter sp. M11]|uniref:TrmH family RNA methyltransferase n=1 Tax=Leucobacter sp. M11 TaxID=2993565 RepID=UPI002D7FCE06|nr:RNA methyltransferase [Leucobacter sp. M11]MEB4615924.1 RNA methyltransferase [Leucobacter sp. M11]
MIENPRSPRVRRVAKLAKKSERQATGAFLLEGPQALREALLYRPELLVDIFATPAALERHRDIAQLLRDHDREAELITDEVLASMADTVSPQGVIAVCRMFPVSAREIFAAGPKLIAVLQEIRDPGNAGTILRAADAAGADGVILTGNSIDVYNPKVVRSTTGSLFHVPVAVLPEAAEVAALCAEYGLQFIAADVAGEDLAEARSDGSLRRPTAWLFGNEARGLDDEVRALADRSLRVPSYGSAESMNLATAASVCLYESAFELRSGSAG